MLEAQTLRWYEPGTGADELGKEKGRLTLRASSSVAIEDDEHEKVAVTRRGSSRPSSSASSLLPSALSAPPVPMRVAHFDSGTSNIATGTGAASAGASSAASSRSVTGKPKFVVVADKEELTLFAQTAEERDERGARHRGRDP